jgi:hypothetical protein
MHMDSELFGWLPKDAANRAAQAFFGLGLFLLSSENNDEMINEFAKNTVSTLEIINTKSDSENTKFFLDTRRMFYKMLEKASFTLFTGENERIWQLFLERFDLRTCQLRINLADMYECVNIHILAESMHRDERYFRQLSMSSEIVATTTKGGIHVEVFIPSRLLILDMIIMLLHTKTEHHKLEAAVSDQNSQRMIEIKRNGLLDTYARQVLILATTICDNILTEYGYLVEELVRKSHNEDVLSEIVSIHKQGVTQRLRKIPAAWSRVLGRNMDIDARLINDMMALVQIRNRLVHPDGRVNGWHAFQLSPLTGDGWQFSERIEPYLIRPKYGMENSFIGHEFVLARFCVDTTLHTVNLLHELVFENRVPWLEFDANSDGEIDLDKVVNKELPFWQS